MKIWFRDYNLNEINQNSKNTMVEHCGILLTAITDNTLEAQMPVDERTKQPFGILHGGANCVLAETVGSIAANLVVDNKDKHAVGLSITTSHIKSVRSGKVRAIAKPVHLGSKTHIWSIDTFNEANQLTSQTTLTMMVIDRLGTKG